MAAPTISSAEIIDNSHSGTALGGSATTITLAAGASATDDFYNGCRIELTGGTGAGNIRYITDYNGTTKVATISPAWNATYGTAASPSIDTTYKVLSGRTLKVTWDQASTYQGEDLTTIVNDTFTDTDGTSLDAHSADTDTFGGSWIETNSQIQILGNRAETSGSSTDPDYVGIRNCGVSDLFRIDSTLTVKSAGSNPISIVCRSNSDGSDFMAVEFWESNDTVRLARWSGGASAGAGGSRSEIQSISGTWTANQFGLDTDVSVVVRGNDYEVYVEGAFQGTLSSSQNTSNTYHGFRLERVSFHEVDTWTISDVVAAKTGTVKGAPILGTTGNRELTIDAIEWGDTTAVHYYTLPAGKPANSGETITVDFEAGFVENGSAEASAAISAQAVTNNSAQTANPGVQLMVLHPYQSATSLEVEAQAIGVFGSGDGITQVEFEADDGVNTPVTDTVTTRTVSSVDGRRRFIGTLDLSTLNDGDVTITATATSNCGLGTRADTQVITYNGGSTLSDDIYYVSASGSDGNAGTTEGAPLATIRQACLNAKTNTLDVVHIEIIDAGNFTIGGADSPSGSVGRFAGVVHIYPKSGLTSSDVAIVGDSTNLMDAKYIGTGGIIWVKECNFWINKNGDPSAAPEDETYQYGTFNSGESLYITDGGLNGGTTLSMNGGASATPLSLFDKPTYLRNVTTLKIATGSGVTRAFGWTIGSCGGDIFQNAEGGHGVTCGGRQDGEPVFTVQATGVGAATLALSGDTLTLTDTNGTANWDLTSASYDTLDELITAINARTGWTATRILTDSSWDDWPTSGNGVDSAGMADFSAVDVTSPVTIHFVTKLHADIIHIWGGDNNQFFDSISSVTRQDRVGGLRAVQGSNFDSESGINPTYFDRDGLFLLNIQDAQWTESGNASRTAFGGNRKNVVMAFCTWLRSPFKLNYNGNNNLSDVDVDYTPINNTFAHSVFTDLGIEGTSPTGKDNGDNVYLHNNQNAAGGRLSNLDSESTTVSDESTLFANYDPATYSASFDLAPASGSTLVGRITTGQTWRGFGDLDGTLLATDGTGDIGALQYALETMTGQVEADGTIRMIAGRNAGNWGSTITKTDAKITAVSQVTGGTRSYVVGSVTGAGTGTLQVILTPDPVIYSTASGGTVTVTIDEGWLTDENGNTTAAYSGIADGDNSSTQVPSGGGGNATKGNFGIHTGIKIGV